VSRPKNDGHIPDGADNGIRARLRLFSARQQDFERQLAKQLEVDAAGLATMNHLGATGSATPTEIARRLAISTAATTLVLNRLEAAGHVGREPHPSDRRKVVITPTPASLDAAYELIRPVIDGVGQLTASMSADHRAVVVGFLDQMIAIYEQALGPHHH